ncbi:MAG: hypothetical protein ABIH26_14190 [Candidatus Eisenbacteria bacterium]
MLVSQFYQLLRDAGIGIVVNENHAAVIFDGKEIWNGPVPDHPDLLPVGNRNAMIAKATNLLQMAVDKELRSIAFAAVDGKGNATWAFVAESNSNQDKLATLGSVDYLQQLVRNSIGGEEDG